MFRYPDGYWPVAEANSLSGQTRYPVVFSGFGIRPSGHRGLSVHILQKKLKFLHKICEFSLRFELNITKLIGQIKIGLLTQLTRSKIGKDITHNLAQIFWLDRNLLKDKF